MVSTGELQRPSHAFGEDAGEGTGMLSGGHPQLVLLKLVELQPYPSSFVPVKFACSELLSNLGNHSFDMKWFGAAAINYDIGTKKKITCVGENVLTPLSLHVPFPPNELLQC